MTRPPAGGSMARRLHQVAGAVALCWRANRWGLLGLVAIETGSSAAAVLAVWLTKAVFDRLTGSGAAVMPAAAGLAVVGVVVGVAPRAAQFLNAELDRSVGRLATEHLYAAVDQFVGIGRFEDPQFLDRLRMAGDAARYSPNHAVGALLGTSTRLVTGVGLLGSLAVLSPVMAGVVTAAAVPVLVAELWMSRRRARMMWQISPTERRESFYARLLTSLEAAKEVRLYGSGGFLRARMLREREAADRATRRTELFELLVEGGLNLLAVTVVGAGLVWSIRAAAQGSLSVGDVSLFVAAMAGVQAALRSAVTAIAALADALHLIEHYDLVQRAGSDLPVPSRPRSPAPGGSIEFRDVWFRYGPDHPWALQGVTLTIPAGATVAVVGRNGAGKSTLVKLLCRFYDPTRGAILWNGVDIRQLDPGGLRRRIGAVFQDYMCYDLTVAENIGLGDVVRMDDRPRVETAATLAGIHRAVTALPDGYDTLLSRTFLGRAGDDSPATGVLFSGGQWQRLALARGLMRADTELMILDEPSSGLDAEAEHEIHRMLVSHRQGRTSLLISHRLGAIRDADVIVVLDGGCVVERGGHRSLVAAGGIYARLFSLQAEGYQASPEPSAVGIDRPGT